jgi:hypothetical protein
VVRFCVFVQSVLCLLIAPAHRASVRWSSPPDSAQIADPTARIREALPRRGQHRGKAITGPTTGCVCASLPVAAPRPLAPLPSPAARYFFPICSNISSSSSRRRLPHGSISSPQLLSPQLLSTATAQYRLRPQLVLLLQSLIQANLAYATPLVLP